jgi:hypothetical protein
MDESEIIWGPEKISSYSNGANNCVAVRYGRKGPDVVVGIRDSKNPEGGSLVVNEAAFIRFMNAVTQT